MQSQLTAEDLFPALTSRSQRKGLKLLNGPKAPVPLPRRQQDRLDRIAANERAKETLDRWVDTVKHNRRAEHLSFPLKDPSASDPQGTNRFLPTSAPLSGLESAIQTILQESGLGASKTEEEQIQAAEELESKKLPLDEVIARRAELRQARELLFREERRAKRIKKIKSKTYRRIHRKERQKVAEQERDAFAEAGFDMSEEERERHDRRRAEERMGARHRESKWAKGVKKTGRAIWDNEARAGVTEMAQRNEELRKRIAGQEVRDNSASDISSEGTEDDSDVAEDERLQGQLGDVQAAQENKSRLGSMKFMQRAEAARRAQNDEDVERLRRELAGEDSSNEDAEDNPTTVGRQIFGPATQPSRSTTKNPRNEFEEAGSSNDEREPADQDINIILERPDHDPSRTVSTAGRPERALRHKRALRETQETTDATEEAENPWLSGGKRRKPSKSTARNPVQATKQDTIGRDLIVTDAEPLKKREKAAAVEGEAPADTGGWTTVTYQHDNEAEAEREDTDDEEKLMPFVLRNQELVKKAFAGDEVVEDFEREKNATIADEDEKIVDNTLPGWGSWVGEGVSKREKRNKARDLVKQEGVKPTQRKDKKLERVILSQKRAKKNVRYMASTLPHPFEDREQYERSLRLAVLPETMTKETFQGATKPRVMVKQGIIRPLSKPLL